MALEFAFPIRCIMLTGDILSVAHDQGNWPTIIVELALNPTQ
jgi:hypothetical protein